MKTVPLSLTHIEAELHAEIEASLNANESIADFIRTAVKTEVSRRRNQSEFIRRGLAAIARSEAAGDWIPAWIQPVDATP